MKTNFEQQIPQKSHLVDLWTRESKIVISMPSMKQLKNGGLKMNKETRISILLFQAWTRGLNGILLSKLFWPTVRKIVLVVEKNFWNSRLKAEN